MQRKSKITKRGIFGGIFLVAALLCAALLSGRFWAGEAGALSFAGKKSNPESMGFSPGTEFVYRIVPARGQALTGRDKSDDEGRVALPPFNLSRSGESDVIYDLSVKDRGRPVDVMFKFDQESGKLSLSGSGFREFSEIAFHTKRGAIRTRTDWAGLFREMDAVSLKDLPADGSFKIAMRSYNYASDAVPEDSPIVNVQILLPPGVGGGPDSSGVNQYTPTGCGGTVPLAKCDTGHVDSTIDSIIKNYVGALQAMTEQLTAAMYQQMQILGSFMDAQTQMNAQREQQRLMAAAHRDYHTSEQMCRIGTFMRSIAHSESKAQADRAALNSLLMARYTNLADSSAAEGYATDIESRLRQFSRNYCNVDDNNDSLALMCEHEGGGSGGTEAARVNREIRTNDMMMDSTMDINLTDGTITPDEEDMISMAYMLYAPEVMDPGIADRIAETPASYYNTRELNAMRSVAHTSFINQIAMRASGASGLGDDSGGARLGAAMRDLGFTDEEIEEMGGGGAVEASSYAQWEMLMRSMMDPAFFTRMSGSPTDVMRTAASIQAIDMALEWKTHESRLRTELLLSLLLKESIKPQIESVKADLLSSMQESQQ